MRCPHCQTENREDRVACYHCGRDLTMVRLIVNRARQYHNEAVEHLERGRQYEALAALEKALELDSKLPESLVLRGTILARLDRLDEASESWKRVLSLDPQAGKAHQYLGNVAEIRAFSPLLRRLRLVVYGAIGISLLTLAVAAVVFAAMREPLEQRMLRQAWAAWQDGDWGRAHEIAVETGDEGIRLQLLAAMQGTAETRIQEARTLKTDGQFRESAAVLQTLLTHDPPDILRSRILRERNLLEGALIDRIEARLNLLGGGDLDQLAEIDDKLGDLEGLFPQVDEEVDRLLAARNQALRGRMNTIVEGLLATPWQPGAPELFPALEEARTIARVLGEEEQLEERLGPLTASRAAQLAEAAEEAAERGDLPAFDRAIQGLEALGAVAEEALERAEEIRPQLELNLRARLRQELEDALARGQFEQAVELAREYEERTGTLSPALRNEVERARTRVALQAYYALMDREDWLAEEPLEERAAREILELTGRAHGNLPPRVSARAGENILFAKARAHSSLGQDDEAHAAAAELRQNHPASPYLGRLGV